MEYRKYSRKLRHLVSAPFVWMLFIPFIILDLFLEVYHHICFPLYGLQLVKRRSYIKIDRHKLKYLSLFEKVNCIYCGYGIGLLHYASVIGEKTEKYWCGIQHKKKKGFVGPGHHKNFSKYGDEKSFKKKYPIKGK